MITVWKYPLRANVSEIELPEGAQILHVHGQQNIPTLWALVDPAEPAETHRIVALATGEQFHGERESLSYIGTVHQFGGDLVWHIFREKR